MKTKIVSLLLASPFVLPLIASAQSSGSGISGVQRLPAARGLNFQSIIQKINVLIDYMFTFLLILAVVFVLVAAFKYLTAGGDEEKIGAAHKTLLWAVIAVAVALLSQGVIFLAGSIVGSGFQPQ